MNNYGYCPQCECYCDLIYFRKSCGCCKFVYQCDCGRCFECKLEYRNNYWYKKECDCYKNENTIKLNVTVREKNCNNKNKCCNKKSVKNTCCCR